jgi:hypothetical protein
MRERAPKSQGVSGVCVTLLVPSQGPAELSVHMFVSLSLGTVHVCAFYSLK